MASGDRLQKHAHGEAFMVMGYSSDDGTELLEIWNSRDGVTPFGCHHPETGSELLHRDWWRDRYEPDRVPAIGEWIWVDLHPEEALRRRIEFVERWWNDETMPMRSHPYLNPSGDDSDAAKRNAAMLLVKSDMETPGQPMLVQVTEPLRQTFQDGPR